MTWLGEISRENSRLVVKHGRSCEEMRGKTLRTGIKKAEQLYNVSTPCLDDHQFNKEELETAGELSKVCSKIVLKCLHLARIG